MYHRFHAPIEWIGGSLGAPGFWMRKEQARLQLKLPNREMTAAEKADWKEFLASRPTPPLPATPEDKPQETEQPSGITPGPEVQIIMLPAEIEKEETKTMIDLDTRWTLEQFQSQPEAVRAAYLANLRTVHGASLYTVGQVLGISANDAANLYMAHRIKLDGKNRMTRQQRADFAEFFGFYPEPERRDVVSVPVAMTGPETPTSKYSAAMSTRDPDWACTMIKSLTAGRNVQISLTIEEL
jgi:hypothetical protein